MLHFTKLIYMVIIFLIVPIPNFSLFGLLNSLLKCRLAFYKLSISNDCSVFCNKHNLACICTSKHFVKYYIENANKGSYVIKTTHVFVFVQCDNDYKAILYWYQLSLGLHCFYKEFVKI